MVSQESVECEECGNIMMGEEQYLCMGCSRILCAACFGEHDQLCRKCLEASDDEEELNL
jgi:hypothetical protein